VNELMMVSSFMGLWMISSVDDVDLVCIVW